jgi:ABC-type transport system involved in multi-copper enzyme maturation permease subunit
MIKLVIEKELREIIGSRKFAITFGVCSLLILLTFYVGAKNHQLNVARNEAAKAANLRKMEGLTDWIRVNSHRIFLPPQPLEALVTGVSNDIGRTVEMRGRGELASVDSRFNDDPIFAVFQFLDLNFVFLIVLSLFAILFAFDAVNGEKERGTLRLSFAGAIPKDKFILAKLIGSFLALTVPLLIPIVLGCLLLPLLGIHLSGDEWIRLTLVVLTGFLYFGVFLSLSIFASVLTQRSSSSFLTLLVIWILSVFIVSRAAVLLAGRAVEVPTVDQINYQKSKFRAQLWDEDQKDISKFQPSKDKSPEEMANDFNKFMQALADKRDKKMQDFSNRLNEQRESRQIQQERLAFNLARISPSALFSLAASNMVGTSIELKQHFLNEAYGYQQSFAEFMKEKTGMNLGGDVLLFRMKRGGDDEQEQEKPINPAELPVFEYHPIPLSKIMNKAMIDIGLLVLFNIIFFVGAFVRFLKYDVR